MWPYNSTNTAAPIGSGAPVNAARMADKMKRDIDLLQIFLDLEEGYIPIAQAFQTVLRKWRRTEKDLVKCQSERNTLEVKLLHARNQVSVEMKRRQNAETRQENMERQLTLIRDLLVSGDAAIAPLNNSMIALFGKLNMSLAANTDGHRLQTVGNSSSSSLSNLSHSDISYDKTEDFMEQEEATVVKPVTVKPPREKRRSSLVPRISQPVLAKRTRPSQHIATTPENVLEPVGSKATLMYNDSRNPTQPASAVQPLSRRRSRQSQLFTALGQTSIWRSIEDESLPQIDETEVEPESSALEQNPPAPPKKHVFITKTVILAESCAACGKRTRFGKMSLKCRECRLLIHPECKDICPNVCNPGSVVPPLKNGPWCLTDFTPPTRPRVPALVIQCVNEIELRGLNEKGIYRVPGCDRLVKDLKMKFLRTRAPLALNKVDDIHAVCGLLKDFLRNLKEPLVTFHLHPHFMDAADIANEEDSKTEMRQVVLKLPPANRDTLAYLVLHLQRVIQSPDCNMDRNNLARVFGPTLVGHSISEPNPLMIMQDTPRQAKVVSRLLSIPAAFWDRFVTEGQENIQHGVVESNIESLTKSTEKGRLFVPLTSPEINSQVTLPASNLHKKGNTGLGTPFVNQHVPKNKGEPIKKQRFFTSPNV